MRVLLFSQYFPPEVTAASARIQPIAAGLAARGHQVEVICELPNHPSGIVDPAYRRRLRVRRRLDGYDVEYVWVRPSPVKTPMRRLVAYGSYAAAATLRGVAGHRPDIVFVTSPPLPAAAAAMATASRHRVPMVIDVRDPWPEAAIALGELTNPTAIRVLETLERRAYRQAAAITTVTDAFRDDIAAKTDDPGKISIVRNGTTQDWLDVGEQEVGRAGLDMPEDRFVWTYAGNVGIAQGMEAVIEAAGRLDDGFQLQIVGAGPVLKKAESLAAELRPGSIVFRGLVQPSEAAQRLRASDAVLVTLGEAPALLKFVPSKLYDGCAVGRPVILSAAGESRRIADAAGAVLSVEPGEPADLAAAVRRLRDDSKLAADLSERGRAFAAEHLRERQVERLEEIMLDLVDG